MRWWARIVELQKLPTCYRLARFVCEALFFNLFTPPTLKSNWWFFRSSIAHLLHLGCSPGLPCLVWHWRTNKTEGGITSAADKEQQCLFSRLRFNLWACKRHKKELSSWLSNLWQSITFYGKVNFQIKTRCSGCKKWNTSRSHGTPLLGSWTEFIEEPTLKFKAPESISDNFCRFLLKTMGASSWTSSCCWEVGVCSVTGLKGS